MAESFLATLELLDRRRFKTQAEARIAVFEFIEGFYIQSASALLTRKGARLCKSHDEPHVSRVYGCSWLRPVGFVGRTEKDGASQPLSRVF
jgi:hypothetical protein